MGDLRARQAPPKHAHQKASTGISLTSLATMNKLMASHAAGVWLGIMQMVGCWQRNQRHVTAMGKKGLYTICST